MREYKVRIVASGGWNCYGPAAIIQMSGYYNVPSFYDFGIQEEYREASNLIYNWQQMTVHPRNSDIEIGKIIRFIDIQNLRPSGFIWIGGPCEAGYRYSGAYCE